MAENPLVAAAAANNAENPLVAAAKKLAPAAVPAADHVPKPNPYSILEREKEWRNPQQLADKARAQAEATAILRTAGNVANVVNPNPLNNPLLAAELEDFHNDPATFLKAAAKGYFGYGGASAARLKNLRAAATMLSRGDFNGLNERYLGTGGPHLAALRGPEAPAGPLPAGALSDNPLVAAARFGNTLARYKFDPIRALAATALEHPYLTAGVGLASDIAAPGANLPFDLARAGARVATSAASRLGRESLAAAARVAAEKALPGAARDATMASALGHGPLTITPGVTARDAFLARTVAPIARLTRGTGDVLGAGFDRYHSQVGPVARDALHSAEQEMGKHERFVNHLVQTALGPQTKHLEGRVTGQGPVGLTAAEALEVENRSYDVRNTPLPPYIPDHELERSYMARMRAAGVPNILTLDQRARIMRFAYNWNDKGLVQSGVAPAERLADSGIFAPKKSYVKRPVYSFLEPVAPPENVHTAGGYNSDSLVPLSELRFRGEGGGGGPRGGFVASRRFLEGRKTQPPSYLLAEGMLSKDYSPAHQMREHLMQSQRAIAQSRALKMLEGTGIEVHGAGTQSYADYLRIHVKQIEQRIVDAKTPEAAKAAAAEQEAALRVAAMITDESAPARLPIMYAYHDKNTGSVVVMGLGDAGRARALAFVDRQRHAEALAKAQLEIAPGRTDLRDGRRIKKVQYIAGAGVASARGIQDLANAGRRVETLADSLQGMRVRGQFPPGATFDQTTKTPFGDITRGAPSSILDQFGEPVRTATSLDRINDSLGRAAKNLEREAGALEGKLAENRTSQGAATTDAKLSGQAEKFLKTKQAELEALRTGPSTPTQRAILDSARQLHESEYENFAQVDNLFTEVREWVDPATGKTVKRRYGLIRPPMIFKNGSWQLTDWALDKGLPSRYLNLKRPPKPPGASVGTVAQDVGNFDDLYSQLRGQGGIGSMDEEPNPADVLDWLRAHPGPPKVVDYIEEARRRVEGEVRFRYAQQTGEALRSVGLEDKSLAQAIKRVRSDARKMANFAKTGAADAQARKTAERIIGPQARATASVAQQSARTLRAAMGKVEEAQAGIVTRVSRSADAIHKRVDQRLLELDTLADRLAIAKNDQKTYLKIKSRQAEILRELDKTPGEQVDKDWGVLPAGYDREADLRIGARDSVGFGIEHNMGTILAEPINDPRAGQDESINGFMRAMDTLANGVRFGIVQVPTVHVVGNLGVAHIAEFASEGTGAERAAVMLENARIIAGNGTAVKDAALVHRLELAGGLPSQSVSTLGRYDKRTADVMTRDSSELSRAEQFDQNATYRLYKPSSEFVFENREKAFAADAFKRYTDRGFTDQAAAYKVRQLFGNYRNVTAFERSGRFGVQIAKLLMFYPWLKTAMAFWVKKGILDPNFTVIAPMRAVQTNNTIQGYDDPAKPFTATVGRNSFGEFRRASLPAPQRMLEQAGRAAILPFDLINGAMMSGRMERDASGAGSIVTNRLNPVGAFLHLLFEQGKNTPKYARMVNKDDPTNPLVQAASKGAQSLIAPLKNLANAGTDPSGSALTEGGLGFWYTVPGNRVTQKQVDTAKALIAKYRSEGKGAEADRIIQALRRAQGAPP